MVAEDYIKIFKALGDKTRFKLFQLLTEKPELCVGQLADNLKISSACVSQHMKVLGDAGLIERVRYGQKVCYKLSSSSDSRELITKLIFQNQ